MNIVPSGSGCGVFAKLAARSELRMLIGEQSAVSELWDAAAARLPTPREDRPGQPVYTMREPPPAGGTGLRLATPADVTRLFPACAAAHELELGIDPLAVDAESFRWRTAAQVDEGRSWLWLEDGVIRFKAEASAWTPHAVQLQQVWVDPESRGRGDAARGLADLIRLLLADDAGGDAVRPLREPARDSPLRVGRDEAGASVPERALLRRGFKTFVSIVVLAWIARWAALEVASVLARRRPLDD